MKVISKINANNPAWKAIAFILTSFIASIIGFFTYKSAIEANESNLEAQSVQCSLAICDPEVCVQIYTNQFPKGSYLKTVLKAAEIGKSRKECAKKDPYAPPTSDPSALPPSPRSDTSNDELHKAAESWKNKTWPVGNDFVSIIGDHLNKKTPIENERTQKDLQLLANANDVVLSRKTGFITQSIVICVIPDETGNYEINVNLSIRIIKFIGNKKHTTNMCESTDIVVKVKEESINFDENTTTLYASAAAFWNYDDATIKGFPVYGHDSVPDKRLDGQERATTGEAAYNNVASMLAIEILAALAQGNAR